MAALSSSTALRIAIPAIDWVQVMVDLHNAGCSCYRVAIALGIADSTARNWVNGREPGYGYGRAVLRLHARYCGAATTTKRIIEGEKKD